MQLSEVADVGPEQMRPLPKAESREHHCRGAGIVGRGSVAKNSFASGGFDTRGAIVNRHRRCAVKRQNGGGGGCVCSNINRRFNAYGLLYVPAGSVVGAVALAPLCVPPGSAIGAVAPGGRYVPGGETICAAAEVAPVAGMDAPGAASVGRAGARQTVGAGRVAKLRSRGDRPGHWNVRALGRERRRAGAGGAAPAGRIGRRRARARQTVGALRVDNLRRGGRLCDRNMKRPPRRAWGRSRPRHRLCRPDRSSARSRPPDCRRPQGRQSPPQPRSPR